MKEHGSAKVVQFVGYSNSGKTTMLEKIIPLLRDKGLTVGVIKHDGHDFEIDQEGKDTWRYREAGAQLVAIQSATKTAWIERQAVPLDALISRMTDAGADLILVEGFKRERFPKVVFLRREEDHALLQRVANPVAVVSWEGPTATIGELPRFSIDDVKGLVKFLLRL
jgi:molybdopterin-guanine dinucleotide biosynthesis protein B